MIHDFAGWRAASASWQGSQARLALSPDPPTSFQ
jgi:hypothetical protein